MCDDQWDDKDAKVVCRMLGFYSGTAFPGPNDGGPFGNVSSEDFIMDDVQCDGTENSILDCQHNTNDNCGIKEGAGVRCSI